VSNNKQKLLVLTSTYPRWSGDTEPAFVKQLSELLSGSYEVHVLAPHCQGSNRVEDLGDGIQIFRFRYAPDSWERLAYNGGVLENLKRNKSLYLLVPVFMLVQFVAAIKLCRDHQYTCIHAHWLIPQGLIAVCLNLFLTTPPKLLLTSHGADLFGLQGRFFRRLKQWVLGRADHTTVVSHAMRDKVLELGIPANKVSVKSMGADLQHLFRIDKNLDKLRDRQKLIFVGRLVEKKGVSVLVEAFAKLVQRYPGLQLEIVGDGPEGPGLEVLASKLGLRKNILFVGQLKNDCIPARLQQASIAVVPSVVALSGDQEGLGLVLIEALGCGCSVVASDLPAIQDVIQDEVTGLLAKSGDSDSLAKCIERLIEQPALAKKLAEAGRASILERFDWQGVGVGYNSLIASLIEKPNLESK
jgi:glycosyltransferase involved in cell wall biosynthesis